MNETRQTELFLEISKNLGEINAKVGSLCDAIRSHEDRLQRLENGGGRSVKADITVFLAKAVAAGAVAIAALAGAGGVLEKILGK